MESFVSLNLTNNTSKKNQPKDIKDIVDTRMYKERDDLNGSVAKF